MRTSVLFVSILLPLVAASGLVWAKASSNAPGKPVCTHYDDADKPASTAKTIASPAAVANAATSGASGGASSAANAAATMGGGADGMSHPRSAPHWQTFLPDMFR